MLRRLFASAEPISLRFRQRECVIVPQTAARVALHADVYFEAIAPIPRVIEDAWLVWGARGSRQPFRRSRWDRAVVDGHFRYPPQALAAPVGETATSLTLTFTDPLIPHEAAPPRASSLVLELAVAGESRPLRRELWRVEIEAWERPALVTWVGPRTPDA